MKNESVEVEWDVYLTRLVTRTKETIWMLCRRRREQDVVCGGILSDGGCSEACISDPKDSELCLFGLKENESFLEDPSCFDV
jgi:hypothetical protein